MVIGRKIGTAKNMTISSDLWFLFFTLFWSWWENVWRSCRLLEYQIPNLIIDLKQHLRKNQEIVVMTIKFLDWVWKSIISDWNALSVHKSVENIHYIHFPKNCFNVVIPALQVFASLADLQQSHYVRRGGCHKGKLQGAMNARFWCPSKAIHNFFHNIFCVPSPTVCLQNIS